MKIPNMLTIIRACLIPVIAFFLYSKKPALIILSIFFFILAIMSDWLDGVIARRSNLTSVFGTFFDPIVDKILIITMFIVFVDLELIPVWIVILLLLREFLVSGVRQICSSKKKIVGANWAGKTKFIMQTIVVIYIQIYLYAGYSNIRSPFLTAEIVYYSAVIMTIISLIFAIQFAYWHRKETLRDI